MFPPEVWLAGAILVALTLYALGGGADFGGGVWDLLASGPTAARQREAIAHAIAPIWEANHVWLILVVVLLFVCFPTAFAAIGTTLHVPLTLMLIGIVLRGSAFTFRTYDRAHDAAQHRWGRVFAIASLVTPVMLGSCAGAIASGRIRLDPATGRAVPDFLGAWLAPFPFAIGGFALVLFAFLAAVYLTLETRDAELRAVFRRRALAAAVAVGVMALASFLLSAEGAPLIRAGLAHRAWSMPFQALTGTVAVGAIAALWRRRFAAARLLAIVQVTLILWGWGLAQYPFVIAPDFTIRGAAAPRSVLVPVLIALAAGSALLLPALAWLYRIFKLNPSALGSEPGAGGHPLP